MHNIKKHANLFETIVQIPSFAIDAPCGGHHRCGKCKVRILQGQLPITLHEHEHLNENELQEGIRLACEHTNCEDDCIIESVCETTSYDICTLEEDTFIGKQEVGYSIALDIGTTTIVAVLIDLYDAKVIKEVAFLNPQSTYGSDVITRIDYVNKEGIEGIRTVLLHRLQEELQVFDAYDIKRMCVCGNPAMMHIFAGVDPSSIAIAPYTCKLNDYLELPSQDIFQQWMHTFMIQVLPPIAAYVGSDIVMGIYSKALHQQKGIQAFLDLGTNGEMALYKDGRCYVTSAACGPAFEGGNMSCGKGAVAGAICKSNYSDTWNYETLQQGEVTGICGSGFLSILHEACKHLLIDESGYLLETIVLHEKAYITQKDVREFQVAKSAIAAAFLSMCHRAEINYEDIEHVYIAGGFGKYVDIQDLIALGILPACLQNRLDIIGNSALKGTCMYAIHQDQETIAHLLNHSESVLLANDPTFTSYFMEHMMFGKIV